MIEFHAFIFAWFQCSFGQPSRALAAYHLEKGGMALNDAVLLNCKKCETTDIKEKVPSYGLRGEY